MEKNFFCILTKIFLIKGGWDKGSTKFLMRGLTYSRSSMKDMWPTWSRRSISEWWGIMACEMAISRGMRLSFLP